MRRHKESCRSAYNRGLSERRAHPLCAGEHKLSQCEARVRHTLELISGLKECRTVSDTKEYCARNGMKPILYGKPQDLAYQIGYLALPAIEALSGNGVPELVIAEQLPKLEAEAQRILDHLQVVADEYWAWGIDDEVSSIRAGRDCMVESPCRDILSLIDKGRGLLLSVNSNAKIPSKPMPTKLRNVKV